MIPGTVFRTTQFPAADLWAATNLSYANTIWERPFGGKKPMPAAGHTSNKPVCLIYEQNLNTCMV